MSARQKHTLAMPAEYSSHVHIDHRNRRVEGERRDSAGGVVTDARQGEEVVDGSGDLAVVKRNDGHRSLFEPQCPSRIAELAPGPQNLVGACRGQVRRLRPPLHPLFPARGDARDRGLLTHHFTHENAPSGSPRAPPGQVTGVVPEPVDNFNTIEAITPVRGGS